MQMQEDMVRTIEQHVRDTAAEIGRDELSPRLIAALRKVPRHAFVSAGDRSFAYENRPLAIGHGQTISQPFIVALMTDLLDLEPSHHVLEIGTGCGYQAAVLAELAARVFTVETVPELAEAARHRLEGLGYGNVVTRCGDGFEGWPEHAPFDAIIVTAAGAGVPEPLKQQLRIGGKLVLPVEDEAGWQNLDVIERTGEKSFRTRHVIPVRFVPLTGKH
jgi:protein-L-isoaspartate(D-aspartate) O-methyltransferase